MSGRSSPPVPGAVLVFSGNAPQLRTFAIAPGPLEIDREKLALPDGKVSRPHATIMFDGPGWTVRDLNSKNGTWVHGKKLDAGGEWRASSGNVIRTGSSLFVLFNDVRRFMTGEPVANDPWVVGPTLKAELDRIALAARNERTVLIGGQNGAGKEIAARSYHEATGRKGPYHAINCAEIPKTVAEQLLFGVVKGTHSEAKVDKPGHVQAAEGGTLFLDEVGELDLEVQAKLLRMIENHEVFALGSTQARKVDVRVVAATNRDLRRAIEAGTFRQDLFFRLAQVEVRIPSLRDRLEELPHLVDAALRGQQVRIAHVSLVEAALMRPWPGNVRDLIQQVQQAAANAHTAGESAVRADHFEANAGLGVEPSRRPAPAEVREAVGDTNKPTREQVVAALDANGWNKSRAQRALGMKHRTSLMRLLKEYQLERPQDDDAGDDDGGGGD